jgi:prevent-host-death family protein
MATVGSYEAKTHLAALLDRVAKGERITITRHGVAVAMLVPANGRAQREVKEVIAEIKQFGRGRKLPPGVTFRELIAEGRRF